MHITNSQIHWPSFTIEVIGVSIPEKGANTMAELRLENVSKTYDKKVTVVKNFHLHVKDKDFIVLSVLLVAEVDDIANDCGIRRNNRR